MNSWRPVRQADSATGLARTDGGRVMSSYGPCDFWFVVNIHRQVADHYIEVSLVGRLVGAHGQGFGRLDSCHSLLRVGLAATGGDGRPVRGSSL